MYQRGRHHHCVPIRNREKERQRQEEIKMRQVALPGPYQMGGSEYGFQGHYARNQGRYRQGFRYHGYRYPGCGYHGYGHPGHGDQGYRHPGYVVRDQGHRHSGYGDQGYRHSGCRHSGYGDQSYRHSWPPPRSMHNRHDWEEQQRRQELEMMPEFASEEAFKAKMMEGIDQSNPVNTTRIQTMRTACEKLFSKLNRQLGKLVDQIKETDLYAELTNMNFNGKMNEWNHKFGTDFAAFNLENEKRNMAYGVVSNRNQSKKYIADLKFQLTGRSNPLKLGKAKKFEDIDFIRGRRPKKSINPLINLIRKWENKT